MFLFVYHLPFVLDEIGGGLAESSGTPTNELTPTGGVVILVLLVSVGWYAYRLSRRAHQDDSAVLATLQAIGRRAARLVPGAIVIAMIAAMAANDLLLVIRVLQKETNSGGSTVAIDASVFVIIVLVLLLLAAIVIDRGLISGSDDEPPTISILKLVIFYGTAVWLLFGSLASIVLPILAAPNGPGRLIGSGYTLMLFVGGLLVGDGMLRTEHLFDRLDKHALVPPERVKAYREEFLSVFEADLGNKQSYLFAALFAFPFSLVAALRGPSMLMYPVWDQSIAPEWLPLMSLSTDQGITWEVVVAAITNGSFLLNFFIVLVAFQFLVLIKHFNRLLGTEQRFIGYEPDHPDGRGGYRDLGRFATRVNLLLIVGGLYVAYQLYVSFAADPNWTFALFVNGGVLLAYAVATISWVYYSFWSLHRKMAFERERLYRYNLLDADTFRAAPVWPVSSRALFSLVSANLIPFILMLRQVLA